MEEGKISPDVIDKIPSEVVKVTYPSGVVVDLGKELTPTQVKDMPAVSWKADAGAHYTLCMIDPDPPVVALREIIHWVVVNIPGSDLSKGETLSRYVGSGPPQGSGLHRYIFLVYRQPKIMSYDEERVKFSVLEGRYSFNTRKFAAKNNLGEPVAANYYRAQYDDYVPILHARLQKERDSQKK